jgi:ABC-type glycerol-3-phosphate transport system substrate-binding protein
MRFISVTLVLLLLTGCAAISAETPSPEPPLLVTAEPSPMVPTQTALPVSKDIRTLSLWVPEEFNPAMKTPASILLEKTISEFAAQNNGVKVDIRVKADTGTSGLMESLALTAAAAPDAMPSLVLLTRSQMEETARKGIIFPYDGLSSVLDETDWYPFARELASYQDDIYGLPVGGDALVLAMRANKPATQSPTWEEIEKVGNTVLFAAADPQATVTLALYRSAGGATQDVQLVPQIQISELEKTLTLLATGAEKNIFPGWLINYQTDRQVLDLFANQQGGLVITWLSNYLAVKPADSAIFPVPSLGTKSATLASGTVWALTDTNAERRQLSVRLAEYLTRSEFLAQWNLLNNGLPPRPSSLTSWPDSPLRAQLNQVALAAELRPPAEVVTSLGPAVQEATILILKKQSDPAKAAQTAVERLSAPATK